MDDLLTSRAAVGAELKLLVESDAEANANALLFYKGASRVAVHGSTVSNANLQ